MGGIYRNWYAYQYTGGGGASGSSLLTSLVSYWKLDEASTGVAPVTRIDSVTSTGNDLTDNNTTASGVGIIGNCLAPIKLNAETLSRADNASLRIGAGDGTFSFWLQINVLGAFQGILSKDDGGANREYGFYTDASNVLQWFVNTASGIQTRSSTAGALAINTWYFVVGWHDFTAHTISIQVNDGAINTLGVNAGGVLTSTATFILAAEAATRFDGLIDEVGFWKRVLTAAERTSLYNGGAGLSYPF